MNDKNQQLKAYIEFLKKTLTNPDVSLLEKDYVVSSFFKLLGAQKSKEWEVRVATISKPHYVSNPKYLAAINHFIEHIESLLQEGPETEEEIVANTISPEKLKIHLERHQKHLEEVTQVQKAFKSKWKKIFAEQVKLQRMIALGLVEDELIEKHPEIQEDRTPLVREVVRSVRSEAKKPDKDKKTAKQAAESILERFKDRPWYLGLSKESHQEIIDLVSQAWEKAALQEEQIRILVTDKTQPQAVSKAVQEIKSKYPQLASEIEYLEKEDVSQEVELEAEQTVLSQTAIFTAIGRVHISPADKTALNQLNRELDILNRVSETEISLGFLYSRAPTLALAVNQMALHEQELKSLVELHHSTGLGKDVLLGQYNSHLRQLDQLFRDQGIRLSDRTIKQLFYEMHHEVLLPIRHLLPTDYTVLGVPPEEPKGPPVPAPPAPPTGVVLPEAVRTPERAPEPVPVGIIARLQRLLRSLRLRRALDRFPAVKVKKFLNWISGGMSRFISSIFALGGRTTPSPFVTYGATARLAPGLTRPLVYGPGLRARTGTRIASLLRDRFSPASWIRMGTKSFLQKYGFILLFIVGAFFVVGFTLPAEGPTTNIINTFVPPGKVEDVFPIPTHLANGTCPIVNNPTITTGSYDPVNHIGHGSYCYWYGGACGVPLPADFTRGSYPIPILGMYPAGCYNPNCSYYGRAIDVQSSGGAVVVPVRVPYVCAAGESCSDANIVWRVEQSFFICSGQDAASEEECTSGSRWGWGAILTTTANGHPWRLFLAHIDTRLIPGTTYNTSSNNVVGRLYTGDLNSPHVHIEINMDGDPLRPEFLCDGSSLLPPTIGEACTPPDDGYCSIAYLTPFFGVDAENAAKICITEISTGNPLAVNNGCLRCTDNIDNDRDGNIDDQDPDCDQATAEYSVGLFQINLLAHTPSGLYSSSLPSDQRLSAGETCKDAFSNWDGTTSDISCNIANSTILYKCQQYLSDPDNNIKYAKELFVSGGGDPQGWSPWLLSAQQCGILP